MFNSVEFFHVFNLSPCNDSLLPHLNSFLLALVTPSYVSDLQSATPNRLTLDLQALIGQTARLIFSWPLILSPAVCGLSQGSLGVIFFPA